MSKHHAPSRQRGESANAPAWQPIETAPKDGTRIIMLTEHGYHRVVIGRFFAWDAGVSGWETDSYRVLTGDDEPTHWMPLPPAPGQTEGGA